MRRSQTSPRIQLRRGTSAGRLLSVAALLLAWALTPGQAQGPPKGLPGASDERQSDPCDHAFTPQGHAHGLRGQCVQGGGGGGSAKGDFNGDGFGDLAIGAPYEDIVRANETVVRDAGSVHIIYGSVDGLSSTNQWLHQDVSGVNGTPTADDRFGYALVSGHFNGDIYSDLAVGVPGETLGGLAGVGAVQVFYGSSSGLTTAGQQFWDLFDLPASFRPYNPWTGGVEALRIESGDNFGHALAWGDFNGDGIGDLAIGIPWIQYQSSADFGADGAVVVLPGSSAGLTASGARGFAGKEAGTDRGIGVGLALTAGDFNGDGRDDLALGASFDNLYRFHLIGVRWAGSVRVMFGGSSGLTENSVDLSQQLLGSAEGEDSFGQTITAGDFNGDGLDDLAVGVPYEDLASNSQVNAGFVHVFLGQSVGFGSQRQNLSQGAEARTGDMFGWALAAGDFNGDGFDELAVGVPGEDVDTAVNAGMVQVFHGSASGLSASRFQVWHQNTSGIANVAEDGDRFGISLSAWNFGRNETGLSPTPPFQLRVITTADLVVGVPYEGVVFNSQNFPGAGAVHVIYGSTAGLTATNDQFWTQGNLSGDGPQENDKFGFAVY